WSTRVVALTLLPLAPFGIREATDSPRCPRRASRSTAAAATATTTSRTVVSMGSYTVIIGSCTEALREYLGSRGS
ncbi:unnamed protein product, partial [Urochloa humidicola]